jgi:uncharacterized membrane protein YdjX (TVP38/TMEM64 family)
LNPAKTLRPLALLLGLVIAGFAIKLVPDMHASLAGATRPLVFAPLATLALAIGVPRNAAAFAAGYVFGAWQGSAIAMLVQMLACAADFAWARFVAREWAQRRFGSRLRRVDSFLTSQPFIATLTIRLLPVGNNTATCLLAGLSSIAALPFLAGSFVGYLPQTIVFAMLGGGVELGGAAQIGIACALFAASALLGALLLRRRPKLATEVF